MNKEYLINQICFTLRHDYGLDKPDNSKLSSGMTPNERMMLRLEASQIVDHVFVPYAEHLVTLTRLTSELDALKSMTYLNDPTTSERIKELEAKIISLTMKYK
jgi:hypothetical protein